MIFTQKIFTQIVRLSLVNLRWAQLYVSLVTTCTLIKRGKPLRRRLSSLVEKKEKFERMAQVPLSTWRRCESAGGWPTPSSSWTAGRPRPYSSRQPPEMMWCFYRTGDQQHPYRMLTVYVQTLLLLAILTRTHTNVLVQLAMAFRRRKKYKMNSQSKNDARFVSCQILSYHWKNAWHRSYS